MAADKLRIVADHHAGDHGHHKDPHHGNEDRQHTPQGRHDAKVAEADGGGRHV